MGNRAIITDSNKEMAVYLHWNGGRDSVEPFLAYCKARDFRRDSYGLARFCQVVGNYFGGGKSIGVLAYPGDAEAITMADDNGVYVVRNWEIVDRVYPKNWYGEQREYDFDKMLHAVDDAQPESERLGGYLDTVEIPVSELEIGDTVWFPPFDGGQPECGEVVGFNEKFMYARGDLLGQPYVKLYDDVDCEMNPNCYPSRYGDTCAISPR